MFELDLEGSVGILQNADTWNVAHYRHISIKGIVKNFWHRLLKVGQDLNHKGFGVDWIQ